MDSHSVVRKVFVVHMARGKADVHCIGKAASYSLHGLIETDIDTGT